MHKEQITLWTIHSSDFSLTDGRVDHNKSEYYLNTPNVKEAYHELWHKLQISDGQIVWCYTDENDIVKSGVKKVKYELNVPKSEVICFVDDLVWNRILDRKCNVTKNMRNQWFDEGMKESPNDLEAYIKMREEKFWGQKPKSGSWWDELFIENTDDGVSALVRHPVPSKWVSP
jgi:hypothetical protein